MKVLESYQSDAVEWMLPRKKGIIRVPAGGGKTVIGTAYLNELVRCGYPAPGRDTWKFGWLAPTIETRDQAVAAMHEFPLLREQDIKAACPSAGVDMRDRDVLIVDECKHATAESWFKIVQQCPVRFGLDATPFYENEPDRNAALRLMFGGELFEVKRSDVKRLVGAKVRMLDPKWNPGLVERLDAAIKETEEKRAKKFQRHEQNRLRWVLRSETATEEQKANADRALKAIERQIFMHSASFACLDIGILQNEARNQTVVNIARKHIGAADRVLVLVNQIIHADILQQSISMSSRVVHSKLGAKQRKAALDAIRTGDCRCLIATSLADEGLDLPMLNVLIMVSGGRSKIKAEQRTGRVLRAFTGKEQGIIYDFVDSAHPVMANQSRKRVALYKSLGYQVENYGGNI